MEDLLPDTVLGLPLHPLVVHAVVVLVPLVSLGFLVLAVVPRWRGTYGPLLAVIATVAVAAVPVATASGENLEASLNAGGEVAAESMKDARAVTVTLYHDRGHPSALFVPLGRPLAADEPSAPAAAFSER